MLRRTLDLSGLLGKQDDSGPPVLEIGASDARITSCPNCARPIDASATICPGCGARFLLGVPIRRASVFVAAGAALGLLVGGIAIGSAMSVSEAISQPGASTAPVATDPVVRPGASVAPHSGASATSVAALRLAVQLNARLASGVPELQAALAGKPFRTLAVATALRALASDAAVGADAAAKMRPWVGGAEAQQALAAFYESVRVTAREGLSAGLANAAAYRASAAKMIEVLANVTIADQAARALAASVDVEVAPPLVP
jgi:hypothetical protein